jgi:glycosidase
MRISDTSDLWWKTAVVYCLDVQTFMDWDDDGMGDFVGLTERLDYR